MTTGAQEHWRTAAPVTRSEGLRLASSRAALGDFLVARFKEAFHADVDEVLFETFPDGLAATLFISRSLLDAHNVWAVIIASVLADAGVDVHVVVRPSADRLDQ